MSTSDKLIELTDYTEREVATSRSVERALREDVDTLGEAVARLIVMCQSSGAIPRSDRSGLVIVFSEDGPMPGQEPLWP